MTIKWSEFGDYDATGDITQNTGVGLQAGLNVRWPAWYFSSSETLTSGASPVNINPEVFHTKVTSGGTGGVEVVNFPDLADSIHYGRPHLVTFDTQTDVNDIISLTGDSTIRQSPVGPGQINSGELDIGDVPVLQLFEEQQGFHLAYFPNRAREGWFLTGLASSNGNLPTFTYTTQSQDIWNNNAGAVLFQDIDGTYNVVDDPQNPNFSVDLDVSTSTANNPAFIGGNVRSVNLVGSPPSNTGYVFLETPAQQNGAAGLLKVINASTGTFETIIFTNLQNADGRAFNFFAMGGSFQSITIRWSQNFDWVFDQYNSRGFTNGFNPTFPVNPHGSGAIVGWPYPSTFQFGSNNVYDISAGENLTIVNGGNLTVSLPGSTGFGGNIYTIANINGSSAGTATVNLPAGIFQQVYVGGTAYSNSPTFISTQIGSTITFRDLLQGFFVVTDITGVWTIDTTSTTSPSFVNAAAYSQAASALTITPSLPGSRVNGNILLAWARVQGTGTGTPAAFSTPAGWTVITSLSSTNNPDGHSDFLAYAFVTGTEVAPVFNFGGSNPVTLGAQVVQYTGSLATSSAIGRLTRSSFDGASSSDLGTGNQYPIRCPLNVALKRCSTLVNFYLINPTSITSPSTPDGFTSRNLTADTARISDVRSSNGSAFTSGPVTSPGPIIMFDTGFADWSMITVELRSQ